MSTLLTFEAACLSLLQHVYKGAEGQDGHASPLSAVAASLSAARGHTPGLYHALETCSAGLGSCLTLLDLAQVMGTAQGALDFTGIGTTAAGPPDNAGLAAVWSLVTPWLDCTHSLLVATSARRAWAPVDMPNGLLSALAELLGTTAGCGNLHVPAAYTSALGRCWRSLLPPEGSGRTPWARVVLHSAWPHVAALLDRGGPQQLLELALDFADAAERCACYDMLLLLLPFLLPLLGSSSSSGSIEGQGPRPAGRGEGHMSTTAADIVGRILSAHRGLAGLSILCSPVLASSDTADTRPGQSDLSTSSKGSLSSLPTQPTARLTRRITLDAPQSALFHSLRWLWHHSSPVDEWSADGGSGRQGEGGVYLYALPALPGSPLSALHISVQPVAGGIQSRAPPPMHTNTDYAQAFACSVLLTSLFYPSRDGVEGKHGRVEGAEEQACTAYTAVEGEEIMAWLHMAGEWQENDDVATANACRALSSALASKGASLSARAAQAVPTLLRAAGSGQGNQHDVHLHLACTLAQAVLSTDTGSSSASLMCQELQAAFLSKASGPAVHPVCPLPDVLLHLLKQALRTHHAAPAPTGGELILTALGRVTPDISAAKWSPELCPAGLARLAVGLPVAADACQHPGKAIQTKITAMIQAILGHALQTERGAERVRLVSAMFSILLHSALDLVLQRATAMMNNPLDMLPTASTTSSTSAGLASKAAGSGRHSSTPQLVVPLLMEASRRCLDACTGLLLKTMQPSPTLLAASMSKSGGLPCVLQSCSERVQAGLFLAWAHERHAVMPYILSPAFLQAQIQAGRMLIEMQDGMQVDTGKGGTGAGTGGEAGMKRGRADMEAHASPVLWPAPKLTMDALEAFLRQGDVAAIGMSKAVVSALSVQLEGVTARGIVPLQGHALDAARAVLESMRQHASLEGLSADTTTSCSARPVEHCRDCTACRVQGTSPAGPLYAWLSTELSLPLLHLVATLDHVYPTQRTQQGSTEGGDNTGQAGIREAQSSLAAWVKAPPHASALCKLATAYCSHTLPALDAVQSSAACAGVLQHASRSRIVLTRGEQKAGDRGITQDAVEWKMLKGTMQRMYDLGSSNEAALSATRALAAFAAYCLMAHRSAPHQQAAALQAIVADAMATFSPSRHPLVLVRLSLHYPHWIQGYDSLATPPSRAHAACYSPVSDTGPARSPLEELQLGLRAQVAAATGLYVQAPSPAGLTTLHRLLQCVVLVGTFEGSAHTRTGQEGDGTPLSWLFGAGTGASSVVHPFLRTPSQYSVPVSHPLYASEVPVPDREGDLPGGPRILGKGDALKMYLMHKAEQMAIDETPMNTMGPMPSVLVAEDLGASPHHSLAIAACTVLDCWAQLACHAHLSADRVALVSAKQMVAVQYSTLAASGAGCTPLGFLWKLREELLPRVAIPLLSPRPSAMVSRTAASRETASLSTPLVYDFCATVCQDEEAASVVLCSGLRYLLPALFTLDGGRQEELHMLAFILGKTMPHAQVLHKATQELARIAMGDKQDSVEAAASAGQKRTSGQGGGCGDIGDQQQPSAKRRSTEEARRTSLDSSFVLSRAHTAGSAVSSSIVSSRGGGDLDMSEFDCMSVMARREWTARLVLRDRAHIVFCRILMTPLPLHLAQRVTSLWSVHVSTDWLYEGASHVFDPTLFALLWHMCEGDGAKATSRAALAFRQLAVLCQDTAKVSGQPGLRLLYRPSAIRHTVLQLAALDVATGTTGAWALPGARTEKESKQSLTPYLELMSMCVRPVQSMHHAGKGEKQGGGSAAPGAAAKGKGAAGAGSGMSAHAPATTGIPGDWHSDTLSLIPSSILSAQPWDVSQAIQVGWRTFDLTMHVPDALVLAPLSAAARFILELPDRWTTAYPGTYSKSALLHWAHGGVVEGGAGGSGVGARDAEYHSLHAEHSKVRDKLMTLLAPMEVILQRHFTSIISRIKGMLEKPGESTDAKVRALMILHQAMLTASGGAGETGRGKLDKYVPAIMSMLRSALLQPELRHAAAMSWWTFVRLLSDSILRQHVASLAVGLLPYCESGVGHRSSGEDIVDMTEDAPINSSSGSRPLYGRAGPMPPHPALASYDALLRSDPLMQEQGGWEGTGTGSIAVPLEPCGVPILPPAPSKPGLSNKLSFGAQLGSGAMEGDGKVHGFSVHITDVEARVLRYLLIEKRTALYGCYSFVPALGLWTGARGGAGSGGSSWATGASARGPEALHPVLQPYAQLLHEEQERELSMEAAGLEEYLAGPRGDKKGGSSTSGAAAASQAALLAALPHAPPLEREAYTLRRLRKLGPLLQADTEAVVQLALCEIESLLSRDVSTMHRLILNGTAEGGADPVIAELMAGLLGVIRTPAGHKILQACAVCLGQLGAIAPASLTTEGFGRGGAGKGGGGTEGADTSSATGMLGMVGSSYGSLKELPDRYLILELLRTYVVKALKAADSVRFDYVALAAQDLLRLYARCVGVALPVVASGPASASQAAPAVGTPSAGKGGSGGTATATGKGGGGKGSGVKAPPPTPGTSEEDKDAVSYLAGEDDAGAVPLPVELRDQLGSDLAVLLGMADAPVQTGGTNSSSSQVTHLLDDAMKEEHGEALRQFLHVVTPYWSSKYQVSKKAAPADPRPSGCGVPGATSASSPQEQQYKPFITRMLTSAAGAVDASLSTSRLEASGLASSAVHSSSSTSDRGSTQGVAQGAHAGAPASRAPAHANPSSSSHMMSFEYWLSTWVKWLINAVTNPQGADKSKLPPSASASSSSSPASTIASPLRSDIYAALSRMVSLDAGTVTFILPFLIKDVLDSGPQELKQAILKEMLAVLELPPSLLVHQADQGPTGRPPAAGASIGMQDSSSTGLSLPLPSPPAELQPSPVPALAGSAVSMQGRGMLAAASSPSSTPSTAASLAERATQLVFGLLDLLKAWALMRDEAINAFNVKAEHYNKVVKVREAEHREHGAARTPAPPFPGVSPPMSLSIRKLLEAIPNRTMVAAARRIRAHTRALFYLENELRSHNGAPLCSARVLGPQGTGSDGSGYTDAPMGGIIHTLTLPYGRMDLSTMQAIYSGLDEPDGLAGIATMRSQLLESLRKSESSAVVSSSAPTSSAAAGVESGAVRSGAPSTGGTGRGAVPSSSLPDLQEVLVPLQERIIDAQHEARWDDALLCYEQALETVQRYNGQAQRRFHVSGAATESAAGTQAGSSSTLHYEQDFHAGLLRCLQNVGHMETVLNHAVGVRARRPELAPAVTPHAVEAAWRLGAWGHLEQVLGGGSQGTAGRGSSTGRESVGAGGDYPTSLGTALLALHTAVDSSSSASVAVTGQSSTGGGDTHAGVRGMGVQGEQRFDYVLSARRGGGLGGSGPAALNPALALVQIVTRTASVAAVTDQSMVAFAAAAAASAGKKRKGASGSAVESTFEGSTVGAPSTLILPSTILGRCAQVSSHSNPMATLLTLTPSLSLDVVPALQRHALSSSLDLWTPVHAQLCHAVDALASVLSSSSASSSSSTLAGGLGLGLTQPGDASGAGTGMRISAAGANGGCTDAPGQSDLRSALASMHAALASARAHVLPGLAAASMESYGRAYPYLLKLHGLSEVERAAELATTTKDMHVRRSILRSWEWSARLRLTQTSMAQREPLLALRRCIYRLFDMPELEADAWLELARTARAAGHASTAAAALLHASVLGADVAPLQTAKLLAAQGAPHRALLELEPVEADTQAVLQEHTSAVSALERQYGQHSVEAEAARRRALLACKKLLHATRWMAETKVTSEEHIIKRFKAAIHLCPTLEKGHFLLGSYYDALLRAHMESSPPPCDVRDTGPLRAWVARRDDLVKHVVACYGKSILEGHRYIGHTFPRLLTLYCDYQASWHAMDMAIKELRPTRPSNGPAVKVGPIVIQGVDYTKASETDLALALPPPDATRAFPHPTPDTSVYLHSFVKQTLQNKTPVARMYTVLTQLTSRLCHRSREVLVFLFSAVAQVMYTYTAQASWQVIGLTKSKVSTRKDRAKFVVKEVQKQYTSSAGTGSGRSSSTETALLSCMEVMFDELIRTAGDPANGPGQGDYQVRVGDKEQLARVKPLVPLLSSLTVNLPPSSYGSLSSDVDNGTAYATYGQAAAESGVGFAKNLPWIVRFDKKALIMKSKEAPKRISMHGSDGRIYYFLCKKEAKGDLRKDSRMMETGGLLNRLYNKSMEGKRRRLRVRTYAVVCLNEDSGLMEWLTGTNAVKVEIDSVMKGVGHNFRAGWARAVEQYQWQPARPDMQPPPAGWVKLMQPAARVKLYRAVVLPHFIPTFHKWFPQRFPEPSAWFEARTTFARSLAMWSMVGHIMGLGDRHGENLLIDGRTGELCHVDFDW